jgi:superfamily II DNA or RNA helicase
MKLSADLAHDFPAQIRTRGASYFASGAVRIRHGSDIEVESRVQGARLYEVTISWEDPELTLLCDCPYFESTGPCKHLWAAILAAEAAGHLSALAGAEPEIVIYDFPEEYEDDESDNEEPYAPYVQPVPPQARPQLVPPPRPKQPGWREHLKSVADAPAGVKETWPRTRELLYVVDAPTSLTRGLVIKLLTREPKKTGGWKKPQAARMSRGTIDLLPDPVDRQVVGLMAGSGGYYDWSSSTEFEPIASSFRIRQPVADTVLPLMARSGRLALQRDHYPEEWVPLAWDDGDPWRFRLRLQRDGEDRFAITGCLQRGDEEMNLSAAALVADGFVFTAERVARLDPNAPLRWMSHLRGTNRIDAPREEAEDLIAALLEHPVGVELDLPEDFQFEEVRTRPRPCLTVRSARRPAYQQERLRSELSFEYDGRRVGCWTKGRGVYDAPARRYLVRDSEAEQEARTQLEHLGVQGPFQEWGETEPSWRVPPKQLPAVVHACLNAGWHVEAEGKAFRRPGEMRVNVSSGVDWFELHGEVSYGETSARLPALLAALRRGENMVRLDDGTYGLLPEEWLNRFGRLAALGDSEKDHIRFGRNQVGLLDALLAAQPEISFDETFGRLRDELRSFDGVRAGEQPAGFVGQLRDYQREGVGWMEFLRRFGFGGCLADDMGVGKTAQVLALLEDRRALRDKPNGRVKPNGHAERPEAPSLVVVPKSLVFNWKQEAARFTPRLRVLDHTGLGRDVRNFADYDLILTTYGTLRRDAAEFRDVEFDYIVLDEAQAIKNANTESAKAARLLHGRHRLALSGTPVENHLGELWSLFEFLNPGMLGAASVFKLAGAAARNPDEDTRRLLAHALRPFFLRRTKEQVARELPPKSEQTIFCEMEAPERKRYNELRNHYRKSLLRTIEVQGLARSKIQVLEALLRLRQAACHPGLLDSRRVEDSSAKLDLLLTHLTELVEDGHKALVFSQFTSLLAIVRRRLDQAGIPYEYLDGSTRNREQHVERFQNDPECRLFLISLKAGGLGLNLTAAEYIFLLDPWWNPAVEAQAIDRAHRIGQTRPVFAYRLIARDTVEEKVLQLQNQKRDLAAAIIGEDNNLIGKLQREDLELLLS